jgi:hypothetical protein
MTKELWALVRLADELDRRGMLREANQVDLLIRTAVEWPRLSSWLRKQYERLRGLFAKKKKVPGAAQEYEAAAADRLDDMLRRKQSGPPEERVFLWFCQRFPNSCSACNDRHGRMRTMRQWRAEGLPGPGVCEHQNCACHLVQLGPGGAVQMDEDGDFAANMVGLREDGSGHNMNQGFTLEPFFSNYGELN